MLTPRHLVRLPLVLALLSISLWASNSQPNNPQQPAPEPTPESSPTPESIKVYTEEVLLPVVATDASGRFDPSLVIDDLLILEDGVPQIVRSVRRLPADVLLLLDTGGAENPAMKTNATRHLAIELVSQLREQDRMAIIQFGGRVEKIQGWTTERDSADEALRTKLFSGNRSPLEKALLAAEVEIKNTPPGNRHIILITDGGELAVESVALRESVLRLLASEATIHVLSYTMIGSKAINKAHPKLLVTVTTEKRKSAKDLADEIEHPLAPETLDTKLKRKIYLVIEHDFAMWRRGRAYAKGLKKNEQWLAWLAEESGGEMILPQEIGDLAGEAKRIARDIDSQYLVTYRPKRNPPTSQDEADRELDSAPGKSTLLRRIEVFPRRVGLKLRSRRSQIERQ